MEGSRVHDRVTDPDIQEWGEVLESVIEMVGEVPSRVTGTEALLRIARGGGEGDGRAVIQGLVRVVEFEVREETANANTRNRARVIFLDRRGRTDEIQRHACVNTEVTRKVVSESGPEVIDRAITAEAAFEPRA